MENHQLVERSVDQPFLEVHSIWETIQGEGPFVGCPAIFVRLAGCNLQCPKCDTDYTTNRMRLQPEAILDYINTHFNPNIKLIVITGGEPFRQKLKAFVDLAVSKGYRVQIETNGTIFDEALLPYDTNKLTIVCSPKAGINQKLAPYIEAYKYVVESGWVNEHDGLPNRALGSNCGVGRPPQDFPKDRIYIQPCDEGHPTANSRNMKAAIDSCMKFGYRLCLQIHKVAGLP